MTRVNHVEISSVADLMGSEDLLQLQVSSFEAAVNPIVISRRDGRIVWVNNAFEQLSGHTREEVLGKSTCLLKSGQQSRSFYENIWGDDSLRRDVAWRISKSTQGWQLTPGGDDYNSH